MKMILQKHTSKFVAGLFNSLGIIACVSLTSCSGENKVKQTENQGEDLKNGLTSKGLDERDANAIVAWLEKNKKDISGLKEDDLQEIFGEDTAKIKVVAEKLGLKLANSNPESDPQPNTDDEKKKEINKWLNKLNGLNNDAFNGLDESLKEKIAQKFIDNNIDITNDSDVKEKLAGFINEVVVAQKESEISLKFDGEGKVIITKVADNTTTDFVFAEIKNLQGFVENLKDKEITKIEGELSFAFDKENVKICGHQTGFKVTDCFEKFFNCFNTLVGFAKLKIQKLSLKIAKGKLSLNDVEFSDDYFKRDEFWTLVKDHADLFGITGEEEKFEIEKKEEGVTVKVGGVETTLKWIDVVKSGDKEFADNSGWDNIFKLKGETAEEAGEVTVVFKSKDSYSLNEKEAELKTLDDLKTFVESVQGKTVTVDGGKKVVFSVKDGKTINVKVDKLVDFGVTITNENFSVLLGYVKDLESVGLVEKNFKFKVEAGENVIKFGGADVSDKFLISEDAWKIIKDKKDLFNLGEKGVEVEVGKMGDQHVRIGSLELAFNVLNGEKNAIDNGWENIFTLKG